MGRRSGVPAFLTEGRATGLGSAPMFPFEVEVLKSPPTGAARRTGSLLFYGTGPC